jgi:predicted permease
VIDILLDVLVPIFAVMGFGHFARWIRDVDNRHVSELNAPVMDFAPASLFDVLFGLRYGKDSHEARSTLIMSSLASIVTLTIALVLTADW